MGPLPVAAYCVQKPRLATIARRPLVISFCLYFLYCASLPREKPIGSKYLPPVGWGEEVWVMRAREQVVSGLTRATGRHDVVRSNQVGGWSRAAPPTAIRCAPADTMQTMGVCAVRAPHTRVE
jgi:hypothetical protein